MKLLKAAGSVISENDKFIRLAKVDVLYVVPKFEIYVDDSLHFTILVFGWLLPDTHQIYKDHLRSIWYITLSSLMQELDLFNLCKGIPDCISSSDQLKKPVIYKSFQPHFNDKIIDNSDMVLSDESDEFVDINNNNQVEFTHSIDCYILDKLGNESCSACMKCASRKKEIKQKK